MLIYALQKNTRQSPRKVRLVANAVKKLSIEKAFEQLAVIERKATVVLLKVLRQATANAWHNHGLKLDDLELKEILVTDGPRYKRFRAVSRGRAHSIVKRTCHVKVVLEAKDVAAKATQPEVAKKKITKTKPVTKKGETKQTQVTKKMVASGTSVKSTSQVVRTKNLGGRQ